MQPLSSIIKDRKLESNRSLSDLEKYGEYKKLCFDKAKSEWKGKKPFVVHWGKNTSHLKSLSDWHYMWNQSNDYEHRGGVWSKFFWGNLKPRNLSPQS